MVEVLFSMSRIRIIPVQELIHSITGAINIKGSKPNADAVYVNIHSFTLSVFLDMWRYVFLHHHCRQVNGAGTTDCCHRTDESESINRN